jgi:hypothetical protein
MPTGERFSLNRQCTSDGRKPLKATRISSYDGTVAPPSLLLVFLRLLLLPLQPLSERPLPSSSLSFSGSSSPPGAPPPSLQMREQCCQPRNLLFNLGQSVVAVTICRHVCCRSSRLRFTLTTLSLLGCPFIACLLAGVGRRCKNAYLHVRRHLNCLVRTRAATPVF